jgi:hypothetical protein
MFYSFFMYYLGFWILCADVSEHCSIFLGRVLWRWNRQDVPKRRHKILRRRVNTRKKEYKKIIVLCYNPNYQSTREWIKQHRRYRPIYSSKSPYRLSYPDTQSTNQIRLHLSVSYSAEIKKMTDASESGAIRGTNTTRKISTRNCIWNRPLGVYSKYRNGRHGNQAQNANSSGKMWCHSWRPEQEAGKFYRRYSYQSVSVRIKIWASYREEIRTLSQIYILWETEREKR